MEDRVYPSYNNGSEKAPYKGFSYSYPLQQPYSPQSPRRRRCGCYGCCCWCLIIIIILLCIGAAVFYFLVKPKVPTYSVQEATFTTFNLSSQNQLTSDMKFVIAASNPNKHIEFFFEDGSAKVSYEDVSIAQGSVLAFHQPHTSKTVLPAIQVQGPNIALHGSVASDLKKSLSKESDVLLKLKAKTNLRVKIGSLKSWKQKIKLSCYITISTPSKPSKVKIVSSTCKLKKP
ncbi:hypothetical protein KP509_11G017200 [Ceratopteris richardii]|uniref:Late embryogenesis abundant protein LEA-2 subgroup domain-containing protein n=1 Tax=Ceratopteris richardii TaxID=49495 RepID=A0A8T2TSB8_CERRI|nr:hypothetical protein KP509_11G017200 [Ceratopteris richardii]